MATEMEKRVICPNCGGEFEEQNAKCPYCGTMYYQGAENAYLEKLEGVRTDMEELGSVPEQETVKAIKKRAGWVLKLMIIGVVVVLIGVLILAFRNRSEPYDAQAQYQWKMENYPKMDEMYANEQYAELTQFIEQESAEGNTVSGWEHWSFIMNWDVCREIEKYLGQEQSGETLKEHQEVTLLNDYWILKGIPYTTLLSEEDRERLEPFRVQGLEALEGRWDFTEKEQQQFEEEIKSNYGFPKYETCEAYIKKWMKGKNRK